MLLAYSFVHAPSGETIARLSITSDKPDLLSVPVPVESLVITDCAIIRIGPQEALKVWQHKNGGIVCSPLVPAKLYLTPDLSDKPGIHVKFVRIKKTESGSFEVTFRQEKDSEDDWRDWKPNEALG